MSIADKITRLQTAKTNIATAITNKGGTVSPGDGFEDFAADINTILLNNTVRFIGKDNEVFQIDSVKTGNRVGSPVNSPAGLLGWKYDLESTEFVAFPITPSADVNIYAMLRDTPPAEYQEVEYLQSAATGGQWIDSGIKAEGGTDFEVKYQITDTYGWSGVVGCRQQSGGFRFWNIYQGSSFEVGLNGDIASSVQCNTIDTYIHKLETTADEYNNWNWSAYYGVNTNNLTLDKSGNTAALTTLGNLSLFGVTYTTEGNTQMLAHGLKMYYCKMWQTIDGVKTIVRYFIPCYRKEDSVAGMYDLITKTFFTNSGTGEFTVGPDAN